MVRSALIRYSPRVFFLIVVLRRQLYGEAKCPVVKLALRCVWSSAFFLYNASTLISLSGSLASITSYRLSALTELTVRFHAYWRLVSHEEAMKFDQAVQLCGKAGRSVEWQTLLTLNCRDLDKTLNMTSTKRLAPRLIPFSLSLWTKHSAFVELEMAVVYSALSAFVLVVVASFPFIFPSPCTLITRTRRESMYMYASFLP